MGTFIIGLAITAVIYLIVKKQGYLVLFKRYITLTRYSVVPGVNNVQVVVFINKISTISDNNGKSVLVVAGYEYDVLESVEEIKSLINKSILG
jgi:ABC-type amino acid transport substrate-binding protein